MKNNISMTMEILNGELYIIIQVAKEMSINTTQMGV